MKTMLKRLSAVFLAILLLLTHCAAFAEGAQGETTTEETPVLEELVVANPTVVRGEWFTEMWGNSTTDIDVRILIHGYNLVMWESALGTFKPDPMVVRQLSGTIQSRITSVVQNLPIQIILDMPEGKFEEMISRISQTPDPDILFEAIRH